MTVCVLQYGMEFLRPPLVLGYRDQYQWWAGLELGRRFLLLLFTISLPQNEVYSYSISMEIEKLFISSLRQRW